MSVILKMGTQEIFRENLNNLKNIGINKQVQNNNMDVIPKFITNKNKELINQENINKLSNKKETLNKLLNSYFNNKLDTIYYDKIQNLENEIQNQERSVEFTNKKDYDNFKHLIDFIVTFEGENNVDYLKNISMEEFLNLTPEKKNKILQYINKHKIEFIENLRINETNNNDPAFNNIFNNLNKPQQNQFNQNNVNNINNNINNQNNINTKLSSEKIDLFRNMIGNSNFPEEHIRVYFNQNTPTVTSAVEKYYQNLYQSPSLVLYYNYPTFANKGKKKHVFKFTDRIDALFDVLAADYPSYSKSKLFLDNGKEIRYDKRIKCIGALQLNNNSIINVTKI